MQRGESYSQLSIAVAASPLDATHLRSNAAPRSPTNAGPPLLHSGSKSQISSPFEPEDTTARIGAFVRRWKGFLVAFAYGAISIAIVFANKIVLTSYNFPYSNTLTLGQMAFSMFFLWAMKSMNIITYPDFNWSTCKQSLPLGLSFFGMVVSGLAALIYVNVPIYSCLRRLTTFIVMGWQVSVLKKKVTRAEALSVIMMVVGAMIAGSGDLTFNLYGYLLIFLNCLVTAAYLIYIARVTQITKLDTFGLMYYNNLVALPFTFLVVLLTEWEDLRTFPHMWDVDFQLSFVMSSVQAFFLNYFIFLCSTVNSPLTTSVTGQIKNIVTTLFGMLTFGGVPLTFLLALGLTVSTVGSLWYAYEKYEDASVAKTKTKDDDDGGGTQAKQ